MTNAQDLARRLDEAAAFMRQEKAVFVPDLLALAAIELRRAEAEITAREAALKRAGYEPRTEHQPEEAQ